MLNVITTCIKGKNSTSLEAKREVEFGQEIYLEDVQKGFDEDLFIHSALLDMYVKCGSIVEAQNVFNRMSNRDVVLWSTLIA